MIPTNARRRGGGPPPSPPAAVGGARVPSVGATPTAESSGANPPLAQALRRRAAGGGGGSPPAGARPGRRALPRRPGLRPPVDLSVAGIAAAAALLGLLYLLPAAPPSPLRGGDDISTEYSSAASARAEVPLSKRGISDLRSLGYPPRPRSFGHYFDSAGVGEASGSQRLYTYYHRYPSKRQMSLSEDERDSWKLLKNSKHYRHGQADQFATEECAPQYDWMVTSFPSCNGLHENDLNDLHAAHGSDERTRLVAAGYWRDVWMVRQYDGSRVALKTMRYEHDYEERNYDRHRRDSLAMERLTRSPHVVDTYGFCGNSGLFEFSPGGDINDLVWPDSDDDAPDLEPNEMLRVSVEVAAGVADMHNIDKEGVASIAHTDITPGQFILIDGMYKLNDFNRARFIRWNKAENKPCGYHVGNNPGKVRPLFFSFLFVPDCLWRPKENSRTHLASCTITLKCGTPPYFRPALTIAIHGNKINSSARRRSMHTRTSRRRSMSTAWGTFSTSSSRANGRSRK